MTNSHRRLTTIVAVAGVFIAVSLPGTPVPGVNEPHYLTKANAFANPDWCRQDFFLQSGNAHAVFFALTGWLTSVLPFAVVAVIGRTASYSLLAMGWTLLADRFALNTRQTVLAAAVFAGIGTTGNFSGEWVIGGFESKVPAYGFALTAVALWIHWHRLPSLKAAVLCGMMLGFSVSFHPVVGGWFGIGIVMSDLAQLLIALVRRTGGSRQSVVSADEERAPQDSSANAKAAAHVRVVHFIGLLLTAFVCSLPGLIPAFTMLLSNDVSPSDKHTADYIQVFWRLKHHLDPSDFTTAGWVHTAILSGLVLLGSWLARVRSESAPAGAALRQWLLLLGMATIIAVVGVAVGWHTVPAKELDNWQLRAFLLKFYPFRFFDALLPMTVGLLAGVLCRQWLTGKLLTGLTAAACLAAIGLAAATGPGSPAGYSPEQFVSWQRACAWIRDHTRDDALILTPRESFAFKWYAQRAEYVCFKDCPQDAAGILEWNDRLWTIHGWSESSYQDGDYDVVDLQRLQSETDITHLLTRKLGPFEQEPIYEDGTWRLYELPLSEPVRP